MKSNLLKYKNTLLSFILLLLFSGCGDMFDNPLKDKETGEDINLLIVDLNIFTTPMTYKVIDVASNEQITEEARVWFTGTNAGDIVTFAGEKESEFLTSQGQLELTVDPYVPFSESSPLDFTVHVEVDGYQTFTQNIQVNIEGTKTYELYLSPVSGGDEETLNGEDSGDSFIFSVFGVTKSASVGKDYKVNYKILKEDLINFKDASGQTLFGSVEELEAAAKASPTGFIQLTFDIKTGFPAATDKVLENGSEKVALFQRLEIGDLVRLTVGGRTVKDLNGGKISQSCTYTGTTAPDLFGFASTIGDAWSISAVTVEHYNLNLSYILASASIDDICGIGGTLNFSSNSKTSFSIDADIYNSAGQLIKTTNFKGTFPQSITLENVPNTAATIVFRDNNPAFKAIASLEVDNLCSGSYNVDVEAEDGYVEYLIVLKAFCSGEPTIALAPTYSAEIRIKDSGDPWQGIYMKGGVVDILAKANEDYEIRFLWQENWEHDEFSTDFDANGNYLNSSTSNITSETMDDGRIKILIEHLFEQDVCDDLNW
ncbi:hypothetical protein [Maribellus sediminis]|uniref:hypothetical protein n=1 Tax=Maribellus sediminis TaxID=2696285 RepID=UPI00142F8D64|nr:hypothetical protein [Maribellus sediminis]